MSEPAKSVYAALLAAQDDMGPVRKNSTNPAFRSKYADLGSVIETIEGPLRKHGLLFFQAIDVFADGQPVLKTSIVLAATGEKIESTAPLVCKDPQNPQAVGGAITYMRRYSLLSLLGLAPEDDDGNAASQAPKPRTPAPRTPRPDEAGEIVSWSEAYKVLREHRIANKEEFAVLTGKDITSLSPQGAVDLALSCLDDVAAATGS